MADAHAPPTSTTTVRYPEDSQRESRWDDITGTHVEELSVNRLRHGEMLALAEAIKSETCTLHTLDLEGNGVGADGARALAETLRSETCTLHTLDLRHNGFGDDGARFGDDGAHALAEALRSATCTLHTLNLYNNSMGDEGARDIDEAQALSRKRRRCRHRGLMRAIVNLAILRKRASEVVFHPKRLHREGVFDAWAQEG